MYERNIARNEIAVTLQHPDYKSEIAEILRGHLTPKLMQASVLAYHENDVALAMELLKTDERHRLYRILSTEALAAVLEYSEQRDQYIGELAPRRQAELLSHLGAATAVDYLRGLKKADRRLLFDLMEEETKREIAWLDSFDEDEIGSKMTTNFICVEEGSSVRKAMKALIDQAAENDNISTIYVVDSKGLFVGAIDLKKLIIARDNTELANLTVTSYPYVYANELIEDCIERIKGYSEDSIPVLDSENKLKGVWTSQDITQLVDEEMSEDYARLAGLSSEEELHEPLKKSITKRLPWLVILLGLGLIVSGVVGMFEAVVAELSVIVSFQSLILGMAGNAGTQALAVTIRVLTDDRLNRRHRFFLVWKEARVGISNGLILGLLSFALVGVYLVVFKNQPPAVAFTISACTGLALLLSVFLAAVSGTVIPLLLKKLGIDPAVASGPLITTLNDLVAVVAYYGLAWFLLVQWHLP